MRTERIPAKTGSSVYSNRMSVPSTEASARIRPSLGKSCIYLWLTATPIWSEPVGTTSTRETTWFPQWRVTGASLAAIRLRFWQTGSTRRGRTEAIVRNMASDCPDLRSDAERSEKPTPQYSGRYIGMPAKETLSRAETEMQNAAGGWISSSPNLMRLPRRKPLSTS